MRRRAIAALRVSDFPERGGALGFRSPQHI
jgi:hypothetical protein